VANVASGGVGPGAPAQIEQILADHGLAAHVRAPALSELGAELKAAVAADPDLLIVLAGDGTARAAAELAGPDGPLLAPLAGGTMNMLPHAIYGQQAWPAALEDLLDDSEPLTLGGGRIDERRFLVAAILGSPALWAPAREAAREGKARLALLRARRALGRAFTGRLRYSLDGGERQKAEALVLICPVASRAVEPDVKALEAAALNVHGAGEAVRLGVNAILRDWRADPAVDNQLAQVARVWSAQGIPALLDGELVRLPSLAEVLYEPAICRVLAPKPKEEAPGIA
jgi:diacylglycerol kinase family enzyme